MPFQQQWTPQEEEIVRQNYQLSDKSISQLIFNKFGKVLSMRAIRCKRQRLGGIYKKKAGRKKSN